MTVPLRIALFADADGVAASWPVLSEHLVAVICAPERMAIVPEGSRAELIVHRPTREGNEELRHDLAAMSLDVIICFSYSLKIPAPVVAIPRLDAVNIHGGLLPECRGANILQWVLIEGHSQTGCTMHTLGDAIDTGAIVYRDTIPIDDGDDALSLRFKIEEAARLQMRRAIAIWSTGNTMERTPQEEERARTYPRRRPDDGLFDWSLSDRQIFNLVRALVRPWPGARFVDHKGQTHVIDRYLTMDEIAELRRTFA